MSRFMNTIEDSQCLFCFAWKEFDTWMRSTSTVTYLTLQDARVNRNGLNITDESVVEVFESRRQGIIGIIWWYHWYLGKFLRLCININVVSISKPISVIYSHHGFMKAMMYLTLITESGTVFFYILRLRWYVHAGYQEKSYRCLLFTGIHHWNFILLMSCVYFRFFIACRYLLHGGGGGLRAGTATMLGKVGTSRD